MNLPLTQEVNKIRSDGIEDSNEEEQKESGGSGSGDVENDDASSDVTEGQNLRVSTEELCSTSFLRAR
jgi:hypothetical protein